MLYRCDVRAALLAEAAERDLEACRALLADRAACFVALFMRLAILAARRIVRDFDAILARAALAERERERPLDLDLRAIFNYIYICDKNNFIGKNHLLFFSYIKLSMSIRFYPLKK